MRGNPIKRRDKMFLPRRTDCTHTLIQNARIYGHSVVIYKLMYAQKKQQRFRLHWVWVCSNYQMKHWPINMASLFHRFRLPHLDAATLTGLLGTTGRTYRRNFWYCSMLAVLRISASLGHSFPPLPFPLTHSHTSHLLSFYLDLSSAFCGFNIFPARS